VRRTTFLPMAMPQRRSSAGGEAMTGCRTDTSLRGGAGWYTGPAYSETSSMGRCACESSVRFRERVLSERVELSEMRRCEEELVAFGRCRAAPERSWSLIVSASPAPGGRRPHPKDHPAILADARKARHPLLDLVDVGLLERDAGHEGVVPLTAREQALFGRRPDRYEVVLPARLPGWSARVYMRRVETHQNKAPVR
jgi:hypothetical protein